MVTTRIDLAHLDAKDSDLLIQLFKAIKYTDVFAKNIKHTFRYCDPKTNIPVTRSVILSNDVIRRPRNRIPTEVRYEVVENKNKIGEGGFSQVFGIMCTLAVQYNQIIVKKNKQRVVKVQKYNKADLEDLANEVELTQKANNMHMKKPAVVKTGVNEYKGYLVMRRLNGTNLYSVITQLYRNELDLTTHQRLTIIIKLLTQLKALHANGIIHRDLKPDNVMVDLNTGELEIFDYGLSKADGIDDAGIILGTLGYIPPEAYANKGTNSKSDIFSMAVVIAMLWYADEPGKEPEDVIDYKFNHIFQDEKIDLTDSEKNEILTTLKNMSKNERDERYTADEALCKFIDIREDYVNRKIDEMAANKPKLYRLENGLFVNNTAKKPQAEEHPSLHSCRF